MIPMRTDDAVTNLEEYCRFGEDRVYLFMAIARTKENPQLTSGSEVVFREVIKNEQDIRRKYDKLHCTAQEYRADSGEPLTFRLYITANPRNTLDAYFNFRQRMNGWVQDRLNGDDAVMRKFKRLDSYWKSELQKPEARDETLFVFDLDDATEDDLYQLNSALKAYTEVVTWQETPNGYHIVTEPFNYNELETDVEYELKTDGLLFVEYLSVVEERDSV